MRRGREVIRDPATFEWDSSDWFGSLHEQDDVRPLLDIVDAMDEPMKSVVEMVAFAQLGKVETARRLGLSRQWVQRLWRRAKQEIKDALQETA